MRYSRALEKINVVRIRCSRYAKSIMIVFKEWTVRRTLGLTKIDEAERYAGLFSGYLFSSSSSSSPPKLCGC